MKKKSCLLLALATFLSVAPTQAQTNDINLTVSPTLGYTTWSKDVNFGSTAYWGAKVGWSFGQNIEVYGLYDQTFDLKGKLNEGKWNLLHDLADRLEGSKVKMHRWGGEMKFNFLPNTYFTPYVLGGAGAMVIKHDALQAGESDYKEEQLYAVLGVGAKINLTQRLTLGLEARNTLFNLDENSHFRNTQSSTDKTLHNWSVAASLNMYLGGQKRAKTAFEKAMHARYSGGFKGLVWVIDPGVSYIDFNENSAFNDQWLVGGSAGFDFSPMIGLRGFYYTATKDNKLSLDFDSNLQMYGANFIGRLNYLRGLTPYLTLGGGYLNVSKDYVGRDPQQKAESGWFAMAGVGLEMPIHRNVSLFGGLNAMLAENDNPDIDKVYRPSQVKANLMYQAGVRFRLGSVAKSAQQVYTAYAQEDIARMRAEEQAKQEALRAADRTEMEKLQAFYDTRLAQLEEQLKLAEEQNDLEQAKRLQTEQNLIVDARANMPVAPVKKAPAVTEEGATLDTSKKRNTVLLTAAQLNILIERVVAKSRQANANTGFSDLDKILLFSLINNGQGQPAATALSSYLSQDAGQVKASNQELEALRKRIEQLEKELSLSKTKGGK